MENKKCCESCGKTEDIILFCCRDTFVNVCNSCVKEYEKKITEDEIVLGAMAKEAACKSEADYWRKIADLRRETIIRKMTGREGNKNGL